MFKLLPFLKSLNMLNSFVVDDVPGGQPPPTENPTNEQAEEKKEPVDNKAEEENEAALSKSITKDETRLELLQEEYNKAADNIHNEFEDIVATKPEQIFSPEEIDILEVTGTLSEKNKLFRDKFEAFRDEKLSVKKNELDTFGQELESRKKQYSLVSAQNAFLKENPKVDMEVFADFIQNDMTPRKKQELLATAKDDKSEFLKLAYEEFKKVNGQEENEDKLPPDLNSLSGMGSGSFDNNPDNNKVLRQIGLIR
ncbi:MAG: hypothetical protein PHV52_00180 [Aliarcobacter sp.]|nr:hypothetical protein [Aliarcobacter sp.]